MRSPDHNEHLVFIIEEDLVRLDVMKANILRALFSRSLDSSTVLFRYYLLGGDTAAPSGLLALSLIHI